MDELKVKNIIIGKQFENSINYQEFVKKVNNKNVKVHVVEAIQRINIERNLYIDILWPNSNNIIAENSINNNSLVCKLVYKNISILFTGDIESVAEEAILKEYRNTNILRSTILKVAHHGSKSSSIEEFLSLINPEIALIGVGESNSFGHPHIEILERFELIRK